MILRKLLIAVFFFFLFSINFPINASANSSISYRSLETEIKDLITQEQGTYGVYIIDLTTRQVCGVNEDTVFHAASTFKVPVNLYLFQQIADGKINPQEKLTYRAKHYEGGTGILQNENYGNSYTIQELAKYSIIYSDNVATNMLLDHLGRQNVKSLMSSLGGRVVDKSKNTTCPQDMAIYMDALLEFNKQHPDQGTVLLGYLQNTVFNDRIPALLPPNTKVAHKIGTWPATGSYHDVGVVYHPSHPYIISLFSKDAPSSTHAYQVLQQLSLLIYDAQYSLTEMKLMVNGQALISDIPPILANDTVYLPLDTLADTLDVKVHKNIEENKIHLQGKHDVTIYPEQTKMLLDNELHHSHIPTEIIAGYLMVPLETITDIFDVSCTWESTRNTVYVSSEPVVEEAKEPNEPQEQPSAPPSYSEQLLAPLFLVFILGCLVLVVKK